MTEEKDNPGIVTHPPVFYLVGAAIAVGLNYIYPLSFALGELAQTISIAVFVVGVIFFMMAGRTFIKNKQSPSVHATPVKIYTGGIYAYSRNPIYVGAALFMTSAAIYFDNLWMLIMVLPVIYVITNLVIKKEETYLEEKFGDDYRDYKNKVRRWI